MFLLRVHFHLGLVNGGSQKESHQFVWGGGLSSPALPICETWPRVAERFLLHERVLQEYMLLLSAGAGYVWSQTDLWRTSEQARLRPWLQPQCGSRDFFLGCFSDHLLRPVSQPKGAVSPNSEGSPLKYGNQNEKEDS